MLFSGSVLPIFCSRECLNLKEIGPRIKEIRLRTKVSLYLETFIISYGLSYTGQGLHVLVYIPLFFFLTKDLMKVSKAFNTKK